MQFINFQGLHQFLSEACDYYEQSAPDVAQYCNNLFERLHDQGWRLIPIAEILTAQRLCENDIWMSPEEASIAIYKLKQEIDLPA